MPFKFFSNKVIILMYHGVVCSPPPLHDWCLINREAFKYQIEYLVKHHEIIRLADIHSRLTRIPPSKKIPVVITFDDGYQNNYDVAFPILQSEGVPATVFLTTRFIDSADTIWTGRMQHAIAHTLKTKFYWNGLYFNVDNNKNKLETLASLKANLKNMPYHKIISSLREIVSALDIDPHENIDHNSPYRILDTKSIKAMSDSGLVDFGAHTHSHPILSHLSYDEQQREITESIDIVSRITGLKCKLFAYPNGKSNDYDFDTLKILQNSNIAAAVTTIKNYNDCRTPLLELKRVGIGPDEQMNNFKKEISRCDMHRNNLLTTLGLQKIVR